MTRDMKKRSHFSSQFDESLLWGDRIAQDSGQIGQQNTYPLTQEGMFFFAFMSDRQLTVKDKYKDAEN